MLGRLHDLAVHDLPEDYYIQLPQALAAIDTDALRRCAQAHIHPRSALIVVVGPADELEQHLSEIGPVERQ